MGGQTLTEKHHRQTALPMQHCCPCATLSTMCYWPAVIMFITRNLPGIDGAILCYKSQWESVHFRSSKVSVHSHMAKRKDRSHPDGEASTKRVRGEAVESSIAPAAEEVPTGTNRLLCCEATRIISCLQVLDHRDASAEKRRSHPLLQLLKRSQPVWIGHYAVKRLRSHLACRYSTAATCKSRCLKQCW